jgi:hypothetical protein
VLHVILSNQHQHAPPPSSPFLIRAAQLGVPLPSQQEYVTKGTVRHPKSGKIGISREEGNVTFSRSGLAQYLIDQARQRYPTSIRFHFSAACAGVGTCCHDGHVTMQESGVSHSVTGCVASVVVAGAVAEAFLELLVLSDQLGASCRHPGRCRALPERLRQGRTCRGAL